MSRTTVEWFAPTIGAMALTLIPGLDKLRMTVEETFVAEVLDALPGDRREERYPAELLLYTPEQVGEMFGLSKSTIMALRISKKWPIARLGEVV
jgi:hypothetical protein